MTPRGRVLAVLLLALAAGATGLALAVWMWFFVLVPFLVTASYAAWLGLTPSRFVDAVAGDDSGAGHLPF
jgi:hypothetical protein